MAAKRASGTVFKPPIDMDLGNNPGPVKFATLADFETWIAEEREFWQMIESRVNRQMLPPATKHLLDVDQQRRQTMMECSPDKDDVSTLLRRYAEGELIHRQSTTGMLVDQLVATGDTKGR